jgi:hypothetical protein
MSLWHPSWPGREAVSDVAIDRVVAGGTPRLVVSGRRREARQSAIAKVIERMGIHENSVAVFPMGGVIDMLRKPRAASIIEAIDQTPALVVIDCAHYLGTKLQSPTGVEDFTAVVANAPCALIALDVGEVTLHELCPDLMDALRYRPGAMAWDLAEHLDEPRFEMAA